MKNSNRSQGLGLVEIMIALGLFSLLLMGVLSIGILSNKTTTTADRQFDFQSVKNAIVMIFSDPTRCSAAINGSIYNPTSANVGDPNGDYPISLNFGGTTYAQGQNSGNIRIARLVAQYPPTTPCSAGAIRNCTVRIEVIGDKEGANLGERSTFGSQQTRPYLFDAQISVDTTAGNRITQCNTTVAPAPTPPPGPTPTPAPGTGMNPAEKHRVINIPASAFHPVSTNHFAWAGNGVLNLGYPATGFPIAAHAPVQFDVFQGGGPTPTLTTIGCAINHTGGDRTFTLYHVDNVALTTQVVASSGVHNTQSSNLLRSISVSIPIQTMGSYFLEVVTAPNQTVSLWGCFLYYEYP